jgi:hypothetical protein
MTTNSIPQDLRDFVEQNPKLVTKRESTRYPKLYVLKYTKKVFFDNLWNDYLEECRGMVVDSNYDIISYPFTKVYNFRVEDNSPALSDATPVYAYRKVNGFMCAVTWYNNDILVSTTGSLDSIFADRAKEMLDIDRVKKVCSQHPNTTFLFECVHPDDPHIIVEQHGMYLLGYRNNKWNSLVDARMVETFAKEVGCFYPERIATTVEQLVRLSKRVKHEGFVFYTLDGSISSKVKSPYYLLNKWVARCQDTSRILDPMFKEQIDEEYYGLVDAIRSNIMSYTAMNEQARLQWVRDFLG